MRDNPVLVNKAKDGREGTSVSDTWDLNAIFKGKNSCDLKGLICLFGSKRCLRKKI